MPAPAQSLVSSVLKDRESTILKAILGGWADYQASPEANRWRRKSFRASLVWERTIDRLIDAFIDDANVHVIEHYDTISFIFDDLVLFRMKKGCIARFSRNYPTQLALSFHDHQQDLFGFEGLHRVEVVYILNAHETSVESVCVVARSHDKVIWWYEMDADTGAIVPLPLTPVEPKPASNVARLRDQRKDVKRENE